MATRKAVFAATILLFATTRAQAQHSHADGAMIGSTEAEMSLMAPHLMAPPPRRATAADSARAYKVVASLRSAIAKYRDIHVAQSDGFKMFAPHIKNQNVYHFTKGSWAFRNKFTFNPGRPTSLLYRKDAKGNFVLIGAMYTAPLRYSASDLDKRIPTSIAHWHKHVNWCLPRKGDDSRLFEVRNGRPVFGPLGVSTREQCDAANGQFSKEIFSWMAHAEIFSSNDLGTIWADNRMRGDELMGRGSYSVKQ